MRFTAAITLALALAATSCSSTPPLATPAEPIAVETPTGVALQLSPPESPPTPTAEPVATEPVATEPPTAQLPPAEPVRPVTTQLLLAATLGAADAPPGSTVESAWTMTASCVPTDRGDPVGGWVAYTNPEQDSLQQQHTWVPNIEGTVSAVNDTASAIAITQRCEGNVNEIIVPRSDEDDVVYTIESAEFYSGIRQIHTAYFWADNIFTKASVASIGESEASYVLARQMLQTARRRLDDYWSIELAAPLEAEQKYDMAPRLDPLSNDLAEAGLEVIEISINEGFPDCQQGYFKVFNSGLPGVIIGTGDKPHFRLWNTHLHPEISNIDEAVSFLENRCLAPQRGAFDRRSETTIGTTLVARNRDVLTGEEFVTAYRFMPCRAMVAISDGPLTPALEQLLGETVDGAIDDFESGLVCESLG